MITACLMHASKDKSLSGAPQNTKKQPDKRRIGKRQGVRLEDLAKLAGTSAATVSRALNDSPLVRAETKREIMELAREHGYPLKVKMPHSAESSGKRLIVAIPAAVGRTGGPADPFFMELIGAIGEAARAADCDLTISHMTPSDYDDLASIVEAGAAQGVIFLGQSFLHERFNRLADQHNRFVVWGAQMKDQAYCSVGSHNHKGGQRATSHLIRLGARRVAFFGEIEAPELGQRFEGYKKALRDAQIPYDEELVASVHFGVESAEDAIQRLIARKVSFDAIFAGSDLIALGAIKALKQRGYRVPDDVAVVGYDNLLLARYSSPALTTISQDLQMAGRIMVTKLLNAQEGESLTSEQLSSELIVRETCGA